MCRVIIEYLVLVTHGAAPEKGIAILNSTDNLAKHG
jgi:hypothetical protein